MRWQSPQQWCRQARAIRLAYKVFLLFGARTQLRLKNRNLQCPPLTHVLTIPPRNSFLFSNSVALRPWGRSGGTGRWKMTARKPTRKTPRRSQRTIAQNIELYSSAYRIAWKPISTLRKHEQPNIALQLHASIRRLLKKGATDPRFIAPPRL
jgi:hypothetical protein